jgi:sugar/nucleoside kinase (ribokinase family)
MDSRAVSDATIIANLALDRVDGGDWTPGGCPTFAHPVFGIMGASGTLATSCGAEDQALFADLFANGVAFEVLAGEHTTRFDIDYTGDDRTMLLHSIGHSWTPDDVERLRIDSEWVHLAPLTRSDFPVATVAALARRHRVSYDGQGLVRRPQTGPLQVDADYDPELLVHLSVLKLADDEALIVGGGAGDEEIAQRFGVPEMIFSHGSKGAALYCDGELARLEPGHVYTGNVTGAGDSLMAAYIIARQRGHSPGRATREAMNVVETVLQSRQASGS